MEEPERHTTTTLRLRVGGSSRAQLRAALREAGVQLNVHSQTLLDRDEFDARDPEEVDIVERDVAGLGLKTGGTLLGGLRRGV